ncbi:MAG: filamentous hemagglutinin N-terminal domain-containing protein, partial [Candidatus Omnitrophica bacterium]|nr:filamentous hemagglutinin N-terminal domain-containing protein [Candidatus Omnitrophota bacterium]
MTTNAERTIAEYDSFNVAANEAVNISQPSASSVMLNRVTGADPSSIYGQINSNGRFFLVNPNGILFGAGSKVDCAGLVASTLDITNENFLKGTYEFYKVAGKNGFIINQGTLTTTRQPGGYICLLSQSVDNQGIVVAELGTVAMAAGEKMTVGLDDNNLISVTVDEAVQSSLFGPDGKKITSGVKNSSSGQILANGGKVLLTAKALNGIFDYAVNNTGIIQAQNLVSHNGVVELVAQGAPVLNIGKIEAGKINISVIGAGFINKGQLIVNGTSAELANGGRISIEAATILQQGRISANAYEGGKAGQISIISQDQTSASSGSTAEARGEGNVANGGRIIINSLKGNTFIDKNAVIDVSAGLIAGDAGFAEISANRQLDFFGILIGRAPPGYKGANFLLDPFDLNIGPAVIPAYSTTYFYATNNITIKGDIVLEDNSTLNIYADHTGIGASAWEDGIGKIINDGIYVIYAAPGATNTVVNLKAGDGIGTGANPIFTDVDKLSTQINPSSLIGDIFITQSSKPLDITSIITPTTFRLISLGSVSQSGVIRAGKLYITLYSGTLDFSTKSNVIYALDQITAPGGVYIKNSIPLILEGDILTSGGPIVLTCSVILGAPATITLNTTISGVTTGGNITITGTINDDVANTSNLTILAGTNGNIDFGNLIGSLSNSIIAKQVILTGRVVLNSSAPVVIDTSAYDGNVTINGTIDSATVARSLDIRAGYGSIKITGAIGAINPLNNLTLAGFFITIFDIGTLDAAGVNGNTSITTYAHIFNNGFSMVYTYGAIYFKGTVYNANQQTYDATGGSGCMASLFSGLPTTFISSGDSITFTSGLLFYMNPGLYIYSNGGNVSLLADIRGVGGDVNVNAGTGAVKLGALGINLNGLRSILITGSKITLYKDIYVGEETSPGSSHITLNGNVILADDIHIYTGSYIKHVISGPIPATIYDPVTINGTINSASTGNYSLAIDAGTADVTLNGAVGNNRRLFSL